MVNSNNGYAIGVKTALLCALLLLVPLLASAQSGSLLEIPDPTAVLAGADFELTVDCYPQALPNDGDAKAEITVKVDDHGEGVEGLLVTAEILRGDGYLDNMETETDSEGNAIFSFRSGSLPENAKLNFSIAGVDDPLPLTIPIAPVAYMDVNVVTPEEYAQFRKRQASAAPIYSLSTESFPEQLAADGGSMSTISATLTTADGKPAAGVPLTAEILSGEGDLAFEQVATDSAGEFKFYYIAGFTPGTVTIAVIEPSTGLTVSTDIIVVEAGPVKIELVYLDPYSPEPLHEGAILPADGLTSLPMLARVTDLSGLPVSGVELKVELLDAAAGWIEILDPVSDVAGEVDFNYYAGTTTGKVRVRAYAAGGMDL